MIFLNLLNDIAHRSWPLPSTNWIMRQSWRNSIVDTLAYSTGRTRLHIPFFSYKLTPFMVLLGSAVVGFVMKANRSPRFVI